jgi:hypothetical protein
MKMLFASITHQLVTSQRLCFLWRYGWYPGPGRRKCDGGGRWWRCSMCACWCGMMNVGFGPVSGCHRPVGSISCKNKSQHHVNWQSHPRQQEWVAHWRATSGRIGRPPCGSPHRHTCGFGHWTTGGPATGGCRFPSCHSYLLPEGHRWLISGIQALELAALETYWIDQKMKRAPPCT